MSLTTSNKARITASPPERFDPPGKEPKMAMKLSSKVVWRNVSNDWRHNLDSCKMLLPIEQLILIDVSK